MPRISPSIGKKRALRLRGKNTEQTLFRSSSVTIICKWVFLRVVLHYPKKFYSQKYFFIMLYKDVSLRFESVDKWALQLKSVGWPVLFVLLKVFCPHLTLHISPLRSNIWVPHRPSSSATLCASSIITLEPFLRLAFGESWLAHAQYFHRFSLRRDWFKVEQQHQHHHNCCELHLRT